MEKPEDKSQKITVTDEDLENGENIVKAVGLFAKLIKVISDIFKKNKPKK